MNVQKWPTLNLNIEENTKIMLYISKSNQLVFKVEGSYVRILKSKNLTSSRIWQAGCIAIREGRFIYWNYLGIGKMYLTTGGFCHELL